MKININKDEYEKMNKMSLVEFYTELQTSILPASIIYSGSFKGAQGPFYGNGEYWVEVDVR